MAKKTKDPTASAAKKDAQVKGPIDPVKTRSLIRLLNILVLLLAITAFLLQFFAVITQRWKWQVTKLSPIATPYAHQVQSTAYADSRVDQRYGLFCRDVKLFAHNDEQVGAWASTRFPRIDDGEDNFHSCLLETATLRGALLTCSDRVASPRQCHCRRYPHWNAVIFFEMFALVLLGLVVVICALLTTQFHALLKPLGVLLAFLAFLSMLIGLIILLSYLKRETRSIGDMYHHIYNRFADQIGVARDQRYQTVLHQVVRRQAQDFSRANSLLPGQHLHNTTHFQEFSTELNAWVYKPYSSKNTAPFVPRNQQGRVSQSSTTRRPTTEATLYDSYGPLVSHKRIFDITRAGIGWSTVLSILAMLLSLLIPLILAFSWLTGKKLEPPAQTVTTTTVKTEYVSLPQEVIVETVPLTRAVPTDYDLHRPVGDAIVTTHNVRQGPYDNYTGRPEQPALLRDEYPTATHTYRT